MDRWEEVDGWGRWTGGGGWWGRRIGGGGNDFHWLNI